MTLCVCKQTESPIAYSIFRPDMVDFVFCRILVSVISLEQKINKNGAGFPFVGWCMMNTASKNHIKILKIEWGTAEQRLCHHLSWPSSYGHFFFQLNELPCKRFYAELPSG